jgi:hypothetical protein
MDGIRERKEKAQTSPSPVTCMDASVFRGSHHDQMEAMSDGTSLRTTIAQEGEPNADDVPIRGCVQEISEGGEALRVVDDLGMVVNGMRDKNEETQTSQWGGDGLDLTNLSQVASGFGGSHHGRICSAMESASQMFRRLCTSYRVNFSEVLGALVEEHHQHCPAAKATPPANAQSMENENGDKVTARASQRSASTQSGMENAVEGDDRKSPPHADDPWKEFGPIGEVFAGLHSQVREGMRWLADFEACRRQMCDRLMELVRELRDPSTKTWGRLTGEAMRKKIDSFEKSIIRLRPVNDEERRRRGVSYSRVAKVLYTTD